MTARADRARYRVEDGRGCIDIYLHTAQQLFDGRDPAPFRMTGGHSWTNEGKSRASCPRRLRSAFSRRKGVSGEDADHHGRAPHKCGKRKRNPPVLPTGSCAEYRLVRGGPRGMSRSRALANFR